MNRHEAFPDRWEAGRQLAVRVADHLQQRRVTSRPLVLALARGGVPVGAVVAEQIDGDLGVTAIRKISLPGQPELCVAAVTPDGAAVFDEDILNRRGIDPRELAADVERERTEAVRHLRRYRRQRPPAQAAGRVVVVVDEGVATGMTARAALQAVRGQGPAELIFATPACTADAAAQLESHADAVICVIRSQQPVTFQQWYRDFRPISDDEVADLLHHAWSAAARR